VGGIGVSVGRGVSEGRIVAEGIAASVGGITAGVGEEQEISRRMQSAESRVCVTAYLCIRGF
jgi:hypothetical protein